MDTIELTPKIIMNLSLQIDDVSPTPITLRDYFKALLTAVWTEGEGFSGKRPFGNSGWDWDLARSLTLAGIPVAELSDDGLDVENVDIRTLNKIILECIDAL